MLHEKDGRRVLQQQYFDLHARNDVDEIQRFVPDQEMGLLAETSRDQHFLF